MEQEERQLGAALAESEVAMSQKKDFNQMQLEEGIRMSKLEYQLNGEALTWSLECSLISVLGVVVWCAVLLW